jgi:hypothetical protein
LKLIHDEYNKQILVNIGQLKELQQTIKNIKVRIDGESEKEMLYAKYIKLYVNYPTFTIFRQIFKKILNSKFVNNENYVMNIDHFNDILYSTQQQSTAYIENLISKIKGLIQAMSNNKLEEKEISLWEKYVSQLENSMQAWKNNDLGKNIMALWVKQYAKNINEELQNFINSNIKLLPSK